AVEKKAQALLGHTQLQHYKLLKKLGEGGMGAVYLAEDTKLGRRVAVKVLPKKFNDNLELLKRFRREAEAAQTLKHPHIVGAYAFGEDAGWHFYVMEYCDGEPLDALLKRDRVLPIARALEITLQVATGLRYAHDLGFIHRDIKPANIFLTREGRAKVLDLGLSKNIEDAELSFKTVSGAVLGTPHYISPEQAQGEKRIDGRTDIYSLGATLYHLLTGQTPFDGSSVYEILSKQVTAQLPNPQDLREDIPEGVVHVLRRMMAKNRADRYRDCGELVRDLEEVAAGKSPATQVLDPALSAVALVRKKAARRATLRRSTARTPGRGAGLAWAAGAAAAALVAVLLLWGGGRGAASGRPAVPEPREKTAPPARASTAPAVPEDPWKKAVDLLALVDPREDAVVGTWTRGPDGIASDRARGARLQIPYAPPEEYDLRVVFTRREGRLDVNLLLWLGDRACAWQMGAYGDEIFGFSLVAGRPVQENPTTQRRPGGLQNGRRTTALVQVRRGGVRAYVDQQLVAEWADLRSIEPDPAWRLPSRARLGLGSQESATVFHAAHLLEVTGRGTPGRGPTAAVDDAWVAAVALLPAEEQVRRVREKLHERNTAFVPESLQAEIEGGKVVGVSTTNVVLSDIAPLRALRDLRRVSLTGEAENPRRRNRMPLQDLEPLRGMRLTELDVSLTFVSDLSPVQGMPLTRLILGHARVQRLDAVRGMPLVHLECNGTEVEDLSPLRGLKLRQLSIADTEVRDLSPLQGMPLESLAANRSSIESLEPLRGMPLRTLHILGTEGPDLAVLRTLPLRDLMLDLKAGHELGVLLDLADLEVVNTLGAAEFWRRHAPAGSVFHEGEALKVLERSEGSLLERQAMPQTGSGWSGDAQVGIRSPSPLWATLELPVPASGRYRVIVWTTRAPNHGALDLSVDGRPLDRIVLGDVPKAVPVARAVGELDLVGGPRTLRLAVSEKSQDSTLYRGALDAVHLVRLPMGTAPAGRGLVGHWTF
ncbi:MAG TPA: serine/threonine-protein kinase, partial [Planctomycetota bacterium]|nr:serine/threonine-protein kinase [Planctomycetota bacterium]